MTSKKYKQFLKENSDRDYSAATIECGSQDETELNANDVYKKANQLLIIRDYEKNKIGRRLLKMLESHDDLPNKG